MVYVEESDYLSLVANRCLFVESFIQPRAAHSFDLNT